jgi:hypothetical protein
MEVVLLGSLIVIVPLIILGCVAAWRERQDEKRAE